MKIRVTLALLFALAGAGCSDSAPTNGPIVDTIELTAPAATVRAGGTLTLGIRLRDTGGKVLENVAVYWSSSNSSVATVSSVGVVTANAAGDVTIAASALGKSATTTIKVSEREVATVQIVPTTVSVRIGTTVALTAQTSDAEGNLLAGRPIAWSTSNSSIATVSSTGLVTAVAQGAVTISATSENKRIGTAAVTVTLNPVATVAVSPSSDTLAVGTDQALVATLRDASNTVLTGRNIAWSSSNGQVATVSSTGVVTAFAAGTATISAVSEGHVGSASILVIPRLASTVTLTPSSTNIIVGTTLQLSPQITDGFGNILTGRPITYSSDNANIARVNDQGLVTAVAPGTARITAVSETKTGTATIVVSPVPVASVVVTPATATLLTNATLPLTAQARSSTNAVLTGRTVTWTTGSPSIALVNSTTGVVTPVAPGIALIVATVDGIAGFSTITVQNPVIASVTVTGSNSIPVGTTAQLTATPRDNAGAALAGRVVTWSSSNESIAFVSGSGVVVALASGQVTISATSEGVRGQLLVTIR